MEFHGRHGLSARDHYRFRDILADGLILAADGYCFDTVSSNDVHRADRHIHA